MKKLLLLSLTVLLFSCWDFELENYNIEKYSMAGISGEYLLDSFVVNSETQSMCPSFLFISEDLYRMELNYKDINSPIPNDCEPPFIFEYENIYVEGAEIRRASDDYVIKRFNTYDDKLILYLPDANHHFQSSQRFHFIKQ